MGEYFGSSPQVEIMGEIMVRGVILPETSEYLTSDVTHPLTPEKIRQY